MKTTHFGGLSGASFSEGTPLWVVLQGNPKPVFVLGGGSSKEKRFIFGPSRAPAPFFSARGKTPARAAHGVGAGEDDGGQTLAAVGFEEDLGNQHTLLRGWLGCEGRAGGRGLHIDVFFTNAQQVT